LTHFNHEFASVISNGAAHSERVAKVRMAALIERAGQPQLANQRSEE
jgi:hypothetical protein